MAAPPTPPISSRRASPWTAHATGLSGVASDGSSYLAFGPSAISEYLVLAGDASSLILHSDDGLSWTENEGPPGRVYAVYGGQTGWLAFSSGHGGVTWTTFSPDGRTWDEPVVGSANAAASGPGGWVQLVGPNVMHSTDGRTWGEPLGIGETSEQFTDIAGSEDAWVVHGPMSRTISVSRDGTTWTESALPGGPVWGTAGWVALGTAADGAGGVFPGGGDRPGWAIEGAAQQLWRSADGADWASTGEAVGYDGPLPPCPTAAEASTLVLLYLGGFANACFGDSSLTIHAHVPEFGGLGGCCWPISEPGWLAGPYPGRYVAPAAGDVAMGALLRLHLPPGVDGSALVDRSWVQVVGHFDDPAAATCRRTPLVSPPMGLEALHTVQADCASRFVVDSVRPVEGP